MRVLVLTERLDLGGAETMSVSLANALVESGQEVAFAAADGPLKADLTAAVSLFPLPRVERSPITFLRSIADCAARFRPDIVHAQGATVGALARLALGRRQKIVLTYHSQRTTRVPDLLSGKLFDLLFDGIIAIARYREASLLRRGFPAAKMAFVPSFIDLPLWRQASERIDPRETRRRLGIPADRRVLMVAARLVEAKGVDTFIRVLGRLARQGRKVFGVVVGTGPHLAALQALAREEGAAEHILFAGFVDSVLPMFRIADVFVFPSRHREVNPRALIEACGSGIPSVCSRIAGNDEIVTDGANGFLAETEDQYVDAIVRLLDDDDLRLRLGQGALQTAETRFSKKVCIGGIVGFYERVLGKAD